MKRKSFMLLAFFIIGWNYVSAQQDKKKEKEKPPTQKEMDKMMEEAMKGMSKEEQEEMKKMMKSVMPVLNEVNAKTADYPDFSDNKKLMPIKNLMKINSIPKKAYTNAEMVSGSTQLFSKLMIVGDKEEKDIINKIMAKEKTAEGLMAASVTMFLEGHREAAMGLAIKAVLVKPDNAVYQNNLAAILTQSGLAHRAIPYLRKLLLQQPGNSTLNNNMGHAWFYLGEPDSAAKYISVALMRNPEYTEARICRGILDELKGDPFKAAQEYTRAFEEIPNVFSDKLLQNRKAPNPVDKTDYQKLISEITIYEYFPKEWSQLPVFENNVNVYERSKGITEGYKKMHEDLLKNLEKMEKDASKQLDALTKKDTKEAEDEFVKTMMKENLQGINMMSKPASYIITILMNAQKEMMNEQNKSYQKLLTYINDQEKIKNQVASDAKCNVLDEKANQFMQAVNPKIKEHWQKRLDEFRIWLNAWCTWRWYITGNVQNSVTVECLNWVKGFLDLRAAALRDFKIESPACRESGITKTTIEKLSIPYFSCPATVEMPVNLNSIKLGAQAIEASRGNYGVTMQPGKMPNVSLSFGIDNTITEPGLYGNPYLKTAEGSISQNGNTYADNNDEDELVPLQKIPPMEKTPADKKTGEVIRPDEIAIIKAKLARLILNQRLKTDCIKVGEGTLEFEEPTTMVMLPGTLEFEGEVSTFDPATGKWKKKPKGKIVVGVGELVWPEAPSAGKKVKSSIMKTTLSNAVELIEMPGFEHPRSFPF